MSRVPPFGQSDLLHHRANSQDLGRVAIHDRELAFVALVDGANLFLSLQMWCVAPPSIAHVPWNFLPVETPHSMETANAITS
ncbi:unnamed protein product [Phytophthora lilii]|uniref:Unnamed protein product n=1 Tax=Phytophthora lilii TaxID=2077276 RepID=A0A9W6TIF5_9STRA|nr:unnamed protein product [Phytophthora lilii]